MTHQFHVDVRRVNAKDRFLSKLAGVTDPETKRKIIGEEFIRVFVTEAKKIGAVDFLAQGTIYPDVVESGLGGESVVIKSHHNVGGLPDCVDFKDIVEPLRRLFKDEVRQLGIELGLPEQLVWRQPFPGPGLAIRVIGEITEEKLEILRDADAMEHSEDLKFWYDGYHFGDVDVYCPWDVMNYMRDLQYNPDVRPASYWKNTSDNAIVRSFIDYAGNTITRKLETLLSGGYITQQIDENLTYDYLHSSEDNLWSILYLTGYLTKARDADLPENLPDGISALMIPNAEIREIFETTILKWFQESALTWNRETLFHAVWNQDAKTISIEMTKLLRKTISYHDYKEDYYHAFLAGIFAGAGYMVDSNKEHGEGRSDVVVYDSLNGRVAVFEAKYAKSLNDLDTACEKAVQQMDDLMYAKSFEDDYDEVICYGISFYKKRCVVKKK